MEYRFEKKFKMKINKQITPAEALGKLQKICSMQEKCAADVILLLKRWGIETHRHQDILSRLREDKYLDDTRFAFAFVKDKIRFDHWGMIKISYFLKQKGISKKTIGEALEGIDREEYAGMIRKEMEKKKGSLKGAPRERWAKLARYGSSRGYEMEFMQDILGEFSPDE